MARCNVKLSPVARCELDARLGIARQDMAIGLAAFVTPRLTGKRGFVEGVQQPWNGGLLVVSGPEIDAEDLGVLLALLAQGLRQHVVRPQPLWSGADANGLLPPASERIGENVAEKLEVMELRTTLAALCREVGRDPDDGRAHAAIRASIRRLAAFVVEARDRDKWAVTHLICGAAGRGRGAVAVTLSYRLTRVLLGDGSYARIKMSVWSRLAPVAQVLLHWLSCWRPAIGGCPPIGIDTLCRHVWRDNANGAMQRRRRQQVRVALAQLARTGEWRIAERGGLAHIERIADTGGSDDVAPEPVFLSTAIRVPEYATTGPQLEPVRVASRSAHAYKAPPQGGGAAYRAGKPGRLEEPACRRVKANQACNGPAGLPPVGGEGQS